MFERRNAVSLGLYVGGAVGLIMAASVWAGFEGGGTLLPGWLAMPLNLPAFIGAALLSGNIHAPNPTLLSMLALLQWLLLGAMGGAIMRERGETKPGTPPEG